MKLRVPQNSDQMASNWVRVPQNSSFSRIFLNFRIFLDYSDIFQNFWILSILSNFISFSILNFCKSWKFKKIFLEFRKIRENCENQENLKNQEKCGNLRKFEKIKNFVAPSPSSMPSGHYFVAPSTFRVAAVYRVFLHNRSVLRRK